MNLVVISPERDDPREHAVLCDLFAAGLHRYHVRKPHSSSSDLISWIERVPTEWRSRLVLHQHHELVTRYQLGGYHWRDEVGRVIPNPPPQERRIQNNAPYLTSRSCHDLETLRASVGIYDSVFFGPVFASISKPGYGPQSSIGSDELIATFLCRRTSDQRRTTVLALGGITTETAPRAFDLGFDGVAVLGAIWQAADPAAAFRRFQAVGRELARDASSANCPEPLRATAQPTTAAGSGRRPGGQPDARVAVETTAATS